MNHSSPNVPEATSTNQHVAKHRHLFRLLAISLIVLGVGIVLYPFSPWIRYTIFKPEPVYPYATKLADAKTTLPVVGNKTVVPKTNSIPADDRLVIPKIGVDVTIVPGQDERALEKGIWHIPNTSSPDRGGNTVLSGHRFRYLAGPKTLYLLDQMEIGDVIIVYWKGIEYDYKVVARRIVNPDAVEILDPTPEPQLTIFTCTPVFSTRQRLVLFAKPM